MIWRVARSLSLMLAGMLAFPWPALGQGDNPVVSALRQAQQALREAVEQSNRQERFLLEEKRKALRATLADGRRELTALDQELAGVERQVMALARKLRAGKEDRGEAATLKERKEALEEHTRLLRDRLARAEAELQWLEELQQSPGKGPPESPPRTADALPSGAASAWAQRYGEQLRAEKLQRLKAYLRPLPLQGGER